MNAPLPAPRDRPRYLLASLLALWLLGISEAAEGYTTLQILSDPWFDGLEGARAAVEVLASAIREHSSVLLPLNIARVLVGSLLVGLSAVAIFSSRLSLLLTLQTLGVVIGLTVTAYVLEAPLRDARIDALSVDDAALVSEHPEMTEMDIQQLRWFLERMSLVGQLGVVALCGFALTRPRARRFFVHQAARHKQER